MTKLLVVLLAFSAVASTATVKGSRFLGTISQFFSLLLDDGKDVCYTEECIKAAKNLLASIDKDVDPCQDFYAYACNGWIKNHPIPPIAISWNQFSLLNENLDERLKELLSEGIKEDDEEVVKSTKRIYEACMDEEGIDLRGVQPLLDLLEELNGWPLISPEPYEKKLHWQDAAVLVSRRVAISPVLAVGVDVDLRNTTRNVIIIEQPLSSIPAYFFNDPDFNLQYISYITKIAQLLRRKTKTSVFYHTFNVRRQIRMIFQFEKSLTIITKKKEEMRVLEKFHNRVTIKQLQAWTNKAISYKQNSLITWKKYIQDLLDKDESEINDETEVVVSDWEFLRELFQLIDNTYPEQTVVSYIMWEVVKTFIRSTTQHLRKIEFEFKKDISGVKEDVPRWQECVHATDDVTFAIGYMYVKRYFSDEAKEKAITMVENIRKEFRKELSAVEWIDEETKRAALEKADYMNHFVGYPNWYENSTALSTYYKDLKIGNDHFENMVAIRRFLAKKYYSKLDKKTSRDEWAIGPAIINAYYDPRTNSIILPAAILESPFFNKDKPDALNYGSIGLIIGHEITHAFDDVGRQGDKFGNIHQWWTKETEDTYLQNARCFIDEYGKYRFPMLENLTESEVSLNGILTLGENIADNGGLITALKAYLKHSKDQQVKLPGLEEYSSEQLFYLGFATSWCETVSEASLFGELMEGSHAPNSVRVIGSVSNSEHFSKTWGCSKGSKMNPYKKCRLW